MANTNKTKAEILQELESIKGLLQEEDDIPILQVIDETHPMEIMQADAATAPQIQHHAIDAVASQPDSEPLVLPGQTSLFAATRPLTKASGENPFLPQHIRERLRGNNPPPLFEYETAKKIINATKNIAHKINKPRQALVDDVINGLMPKVEAELRHRLFAMSVEDLEKLLNEDENETSSSHFD